MTHNSSCNIQICYPPVKRQYSVFNIRRYFNFETSDLHVALTVVHFLYDMSSAASRLFKDSMQIYRQCKSTKCSYIGYLVVVETTVFELGCFKVL